MIRRAAVAALLVAAACGGRPVTPPYRAAPAADAGVTIAPDAADPTNGGRDRLRADALARQPVDPAMGEVLSSLRGFRDRACACADAACAEAVSAEQVEWGFEHKDLLDAAHGSAAQDREASMLIEATEECIERAYHVDRVDRAGTAAPVR